MGWAALLHRASSKSIIRVWFDVRNQIGVVNKAEVVAATRAKGAATARNVQRNLLVGML